MKPTGVRYLLLGVATANAFLLYLDRICMAAVVQSASFQKEMSFDKQRTGDVLASFFFAYALGQMPAGWLADRFGPRRMLVAYIGLWSLCTAFTGFVTGLLVLVIVRWACGLAEAGAYPSSALVISRWFPLNQRARANSVVTFGGRVGNSMALWLTAAAIAAFGSWRPVLWTYGAIGLVLAVATYVVFRDSPREHPWTNEAERQMTTPVKTAHYKMPWRELIRHSGLWFFNAGNMGLNIGWAFLITSGCRRICRTLVRQAGSCDREPLCGRWRSHSAWEECSSAAGGATFTYQKALGQRWGRSLALSDPAAPCASWLTSSVRYSQARWQSQ